MPNGITERQRGGLGTYPQVVASKAKEGRGAPGIIRELNRRTLLIRSAFHLLIFRVKLIWDLMITEGNK